MNLDAFESSLSHLPEKHQHPVWKIFARLIITLVWIVFLGPAAIAAGFWEAGRESVRTSAQQKKRTGIRKRKRTFQAATFQSDIRGLAKGMLGFTAYFGIILLLARCVSGLKPEPSDYGLHFPDAIKPGVTEPAMVGPGDDVKLYLSGESYSSIFGYWQAEKVSASATSIYWEAGRMQQWQLENISSSTKEWGGTLWYQPCHKPVTRCYPKSGSFAVWVKFKLPDDQRLAGQTLVVTANIDFIFPVLYKREMRFGNVPSHLYNQVWLKIADKDEQASFKKWERDLSRWKTWGGFFTKILVALTLIGILFLIVSLMSLAQESPWDKWFRRVPN